MILQASLMLCLLFGFHGLQAQSITYNHTGGSQTYTVPVGVTLLNVDVYGGEGRLNSSGQGGGGLGGRVQATIPVTPGEILEINVGGGGAISNIGGFNGGGDALIGSGCPQSIGGGGGGMSSIMRAPYTFNSTLALVVAGGGGGAGGTRTQGCGPGGGGGGGGGWFGGGGGGAYNGGGGGGGTQSAGGAGGAVGFAGSSGTAGVAGQGGTGGDPVANNQSGTNPGMPGGAGGGLNAAAGTPASGSWQGGGGGGGSSYTFSGATNVIHSQGVHSGDGQIIITVANCAQPSGVTATPSTICVGGSANLNAISAGNSIRWYTVPSGGSPIGTVTSGTNFPVTPGSTTTYYAEAFGICSASARTAVTVTVSQIPTTSNAGPDQTLCATSATLAGNSPAAGTGTWSIISGAGGNILSPTSPTSTFNGISGNTYTLRWTISSAPCASSTDDVVIAFTPNPSAANAGPDQTLCGSSATLAGNAPSIGTGAWSILSGTGGSVTTPTSPTSAFTGVQGNSYTLRWTTSNAPCTASIDNVVITFINNPTTSNAGPDQTLCATSATLAGNTPANGVGSWSIVSGTGGTITNPASPNSLFSGVQGNTYTLRWSITNAPCAASTDDVVIAFTPNPSVANAGVDQTICSTSATMAGNSPAIGTGSWSVISGAGGSFIAPTSPTSAFSGVQGTVYTLRWTIANAPCSASLDDMILTITNNPTVANAGPDQSVCANSVTLAGNTPTVGTGAWSVVTGAGGTITTPTSPTSTFTGVTGTVYTLRWTVSNPPCAPTTDDVQVYFTPAPTVANAGPDQAVCGTSVTLASNSPTNGAGTWSILSGAGGSITAPNSPVSGFTGVQGTVYTLRWTITNSPCAASTDNVIITLTSPPSLANAGVDQTVCTGSTTMNAATPSIGTGAWTVVSGTGGVALTPSSPTSVFTGNSGITYTLRWTVTNAPCPSNSDDVVVTIAQSPTQANAGADQVLCNTSTTLTGNTPTVGTGNWTVVSGTGGTIVNPSIPNSPFTLTPGNTNTLRWTISNAPCPSSSDDVVISSDNILPTINCPGNIVTPSNPAQCSAVVTYTTPNGTDNCPNPTTTQIAGLASGATYPPGITTNTFRVTDAFGNSASCTFTVNVTDSQLPVIACPSNITMTAEPGICTATVNYNTPVGTDNCANPVTTQTSGLPSGSAFPVGNTFVTYRVTDVVGNTASCSFLVAVTDNEGPTILCPANVVVSAANGLCNETVTYSAPVANDNCGGFTVTQVSGSPSGAVFQAGTTNITYQVSDAVSNTATCSFTVTVLDSEAPTITCPANITANNIPNQCVATVSYTTPVASDNCVGMTLVRTAGLASGSSFPAGVTTISYRATDASSNSATCDFTITVVDTEAPVAACQNITTQLDSTGNGIVNANAMNNGSTDNCSSLTATASPSTFTCADLGFQNVTLTITDQDGNSSTCNAQVRVVPSAVLISITADTFSCGYNTSCFASSDGRATASGRGGCGSFTYHWSNGQNLATATGLGGGTHTVTVTDATGGASTATITLTAPPPFVVTTTPTSSCAGDSIGTITTTSVGGNDCNPHTYAWSTGATTASLTGLAPGIYNLTVTDGGGCTVTRSVTVGTLSAPNPVFTQSGNTLTSTQTWSTYQWMLNGSPIPGATANSYTYSQSGSYSLSVTGSNGCTGVSASQEVVYVGISDPANSWGGLAIFPNPAHDEFKLRTEQPINHGFTVGVVDMYGRQLYAKSFTHMSYEEAFTLKDVAAGTYFVEVTSTKGQRKSFKLVVQ